MSKLRKINLSEGYPLGWMQGEGIDYYYITEREETAKTTKKGETTK